MQKLILASTLSLTLVGCGGGSSGSTVDVNEVSTVSIIGSWNTVISISACPNVTANYTSDFQTLNNSTIYRLQRYGGGGANLVNYNTCQPVSFSGDYLDVSSAYMPINPTKAQLSEFAKYGTALYYGLSTNDITVTVNTFQADRLSYTATVRSGGQTISETSVLTR